MNLQEIIEEVTDSKNKNMSRNRPYSGQMHTDKSERGKQVVEGLTMRDLRDCMVRAFFQSAGHIVPDLYRESCKGEMAEISDNDLYGWDLNQIDPIAVTQNFTCEVEKMMGIFPNVPALEEVM